MNPVSRVDLVMEGRRRNRVKRDYLVKSLTAFPYRVRAANPVRAKSPIPCGYCLK